MKTNHLELSAKINGVKGRFILDTGASNTCIGLNFAEKFNVISKESDVKASGAGGTMEMETHISEKNKLKIGKWKTKKSKLVLFDLQHINDALKHHNEEEVNGIIGADILEKGKVIIDYNKNILYLKKPKNKRFKKDELPF